LLPGEYYHFIAAGRFIGAIRFSSVPREPIQMIFVLIPVIHGMYLLRQVKCNPFQTEFQVFLSKFHQKSLDKKFFPNYCKRFISHFYAVFLRFSHLQKNFRHLVFSNKEC